MYYNALFCRQVMRIPNTFLSSYKLDSKGKFHQWINEEKRYQILIQGDSSYM